MVPPVASVTVVGMGQQLWLIRHGETEWSRSGQHTSRTDLPLTAEGEARARLLADGLRGHPFDLVLSSPLRRALDTCRLAGLGASAVIDEHLREWDYGDYEGLKTSEIFSRHPGWDLFSMGCPGGERPDQFAARCDAFSQTLVREAAGRAVVAFTHGHLSRVLTSRLLGLPSSTAAALFNETASVSVINVHRSRWVLVGWNICAER